MSNLNRCTQNLLMDPKAAAMLLKWWIWIPGEILQSSWTENGKRYKLVELAARRHKYRADFWIPVLTGKIMKSGGVDFTTNSQQANHAIVKDLLMHLFLITAPRVGDMKSVTGFWIDTAWYRHNKKLAYQFFQALQTHKVQKQNLVWTSHKVWMGDSQHKCFEIKERVMPKQDLPDEYTPVVIESDSSGNIVVNDGLHFDFHDESDPF